MKKIQICLTAISFICLYFQSLQAAAVDKKTLAPINILNAVVYVPLGSGQTTTAFFTVQNNSATDVSITKITSPSVKKITLVPEASPRVNAKASAASKSVSAITDASSLWLIPAGKLLVLDPKHQYIQLTGLKNSLTTGDELQLEISLSNGKKLIVIARAKSAYDQAHSN